MAAKAIDHCSRCKREAPAAMSGPEGAAAQGWKTFEDDDGNFLGTVCPGCQTGEDVDAAWPDYPPEEAR